jgi:enamine deaminase RidA (YjgF/YER057c/UK114 family)
MSQNANIGGSVEHINPENLHKNRAFTQVVSVSGPVKTIYIGGQDSVDVQGNIIGKGDLKLQTRQAFENMQKALNAAGAGPEHLVKCTVYLVQGQPLQPGFEAYGQFWGNRPNPPTVSVLFVSGLAHPDFLVEIDAIAVIPHA